MPWVYVYIIVLIIATVLQIVLAPKPSYPAAAPRALDNVPVAEQGKPIPVVFGTRFVPQPNVVWYGAVRNTPIRKKMGSGGSS